MMHHQQVCRECVDDPPISYPLCFLACGDRKYDDANAWSLDQICEKCFENTQVMKSVCSRNCGHSGADKKKRICWKCYENGMIQ